jgi:hypothetical protein
LYGESGNDVLAVEKVGFGEPLNWLAGPLDGGRSLDRVYPPHEWNVRAFVEVHLAADISGLICWRNYLNGEIGSRGKISASPRPKFAPLDSNESKVGSDD